MATVYVIWDRKEKDLMRPISIFPTSAAATLHLARIPRHDGGKNQNNTSYVFDVVSVTV